MPYSQRLTGRQFLITAGLHQNKYKHLKCCIRSAVPLALQVFEELNFDVFTPDAYKPQGLGLFDRLAEQDKRC